jgi:phage gpG-like protein
MAFRIGIDFVGLGDARGGVAALKAKARNLRPLMERIGIEVATDAKVGFDRKQDPDGIRWRPWAPATARKRAEEHAAGKGPYTLMVYNGKAKDYPAHLRDSVQFDATNTSVTIGFRKKTAIKHELGGAKLPVRRVLGGYAGGFGARVSSRIESLIGSYF